jgi:diguanylate cyclase (GGDEF)-like protein
VSPVDPTFRQGLLDLLSNEPADEARTLAAIEARAKRRQPVYSTLLEILTHLSFSEGEARRHWRRVVAHRREMHDKLERDPGLRVALLDWFANVNHELRNPKVIEIAIYENTERSAQTDGLTGLYNHAFLVQALRRELQRARRHARAAALVMLDLDDFKRVNDTRGHPVGDRVLVTVATLVRGCLREIDTAARYGGEEFALLLPETSRAGAVVVAERIRDKAERHFARRRGGPRVTLSGGVATFPDDASDAEGLIRRADQALYRAKAAGKNRVLAARARASGGRTSGRSL